MVNDLIWFNGEFQGIFIKLCSGSKKMW